MLRLFSGALLVVVVFAQSNHNEFRGYKCVKKESGEGTDCSLTLKKHVDAVEEYPVEKNRGCFEENDRVYCPMFCADAFAGFVIGKVPTYNHKCIKFVSYKVEPRDGEWYFWRSGSCLNEDIEFRLGCSFAYTVEDVRDVREFLVKKASV